MRVLALLFVIVTLPARAINPSPFFVVADDYIAQDLVSEHEAALMDFKKVANQVGYKTSWRFYQFDDGRHVAFNKQESYDYKATDAEKWNEVSDKFPEGFLEANGEVYGRTIMRQNFYLINHVPSLSNEPKSSEEAWPYLVWIELNTDGTGGGELRSWVSSQKESEEPFYLSTYRNEYPSGDAKYFMVFKASSFQSWYTKLEKLGTHDPIQLLPKEFKVGIKNYEISLAKYIPEISY